MKKVAVAMSGGVDSSTAAAILKERGYEVFGVTMLLSDTGRERNDLEQQLSEGAIHDAVQVCAKLGIEHHVVDFRDIFQKEVKDYFVKEYLAARTPNPCVRCNNKIKFGALLEACKKLGADYLATGHYLRIVQENGRYLLRRGLDAKKDQSYMLYHLSQPVLAQLMFPLGDYEKSKVREIAKEYGLSVANKKESQEICFVPDDDYKKYLLENIKKPLPQGVICDGSGKVLGKHKGLPFYTIGQRKGMGIAAAEPLYVTKLDKEKNTVIVGTKNEVYASGLVASHVNWIAFETVEKPLLVQAQIRYGKNTFAARVITMENGLAKVIFEQPQRAVTPGQSVVFYEKETLLGGGIIESAI